MWNQVNQPTYSLYIVHYSIQYVGMKRKNHNQHSLPTKKRNKSSGKSVRGTLSTGYYNQIFIQ